MISESGQTLSQIQTVMSQALSAPSPDDPQKPSRALVAIGRKGIELTNMDELFRFSNAVAQSGLAPKGLEKPEAVFVAVQLGLEVGLTPMAALQNIAPINGRPGLWGDAVLAVCRSTSELEVFEEWFERGPDDRPVRLARNPMEYPDDLRAVCRVKRHGYPPAEVAFSVADAKRAQLWGKAGPWTQYPFRMLKARARSFALRDQFGDALRGIHSVEELQDQPKTVGGRVVEDAVVPATPLLQEPVNLGERPAAAAKTGKGEPASDAARATTEPAPDRSQAAQSAPATQEQAARPSPARKKAAPAPVPSLQLVSEPAPAPAPAPTAGGSALVAQVEDLLTQWGIRWNTIAAVLIQNEVIDMATESVVETPDAVLDQVVRSWAQLVQLARGGDR